MKISTNIKRPVAFMLATVMLTNCTVYSPVVTKPASMEPGNELMLHKDGLRLKLVEPAVRADTLFARISHDQSVPGKKNRITVVLKPGQEQTQDRSGVVAIPLSQVDYVEYFEKDHDRSRNLTIAAVSLGVFGIGVVFFGMLLQAMIELEDSHKNGF